MSAAVAQRNSPHTTSIHSTSRTHSPMDTKRNLNIKPETKKESSLKGSQKVESSPPKDSTTKEQSADSVKQELKPAGPGSDAEATQPLAPPPRPQQNNSDNPDYFSTQHKNHLSYEPNPFEQSFSNPATETPGKSLLPPVASLTSPAPLTGNTSLGGGFSWTGSLRSGPLSPAMLSGPQGDYFDSIRSFPTPNESSLRTGLTPGGGGSMFPAPSPGSQAFLNTLASGGATPSTLDFQRAAVNAATATKSDSVFTSPTTTQATVPRSQTAAMDSSTAHTGFGQHDNDAANGLYLLAQAGNESQTNPQFAVSNGSATINNQDQPPTRSTRNNQGSIGGSISAASAQGPSEGLSDGEGKQSTRKSKRTSAGKNPKTRKAEETPIKQPASKKSKASNGQAREPSMDDDDDDDDDEDMKEMKGADGRKMTDEEKRKNFLERNRVAALKCRQRKKQWLQNLQNKVEIFSSENDALNAQVAQLRDEVINLKTILIAHKDCPIAQQQSATGSYLQPGVDYGGAPNPYPMGMQAQQPVGITGPRRFS